MQAGAQTFDRCDKGVVVNTAGETKHVRLQVVDDNIIRVTATPEDAFSTRPSLIVVPQKQKAQYAVEDGGSTVTVKAKNVSATVDKTTGHVTFKDAQGNVWLDEHSKSFKPFTVPDREVGVGTLTDEQRNAWTWHLTFDSPQDEAFYGLGQHQSEDMNYKNKNEELFQYNTKVSVPFVVSNKNYGLLWDSYSYCRWGNPEDY